MRRKLFVTATFVFGMLAYVSPQFAQDSATEIDPTAARASEDSPAESKPQSNAGQPTPRAVTTESRSRRNSELKPQAANASGSAEVDAHSNATTANSETDHALQSRQIKIFTLAHIAPADAKKILDDLYRDMTQPGRAAAASSQLRIAIDQRTNSLVISGNNDVLKPIEALLMKLDAADESQKKLLLSVPLRNMSATDALAATEQLQLTKTTLRADMVRNMLIGSGPSEELNRANEFVTRLDKESGGGPAQDLHVRVLWLVDSSLVEKDVAAVPEDLNSAISKLSKRVGLGELRTAAQFVVKVQASPSTAFKAAGTAQLLNPCKVHFEGALRMDDEGKCHVEVQATAHGEGDFETSQLSSVQTTIKTTPGHPVILGLTPINSKPSLFVVEIIQTELADDTNAEKAHDTK